MNILITYFLETLLVSSFFCFGYLAIKNMTTPTVKRVFLLTWLLASFIFPLISIESELVPDISFQSFSVKDQDATMTYDQDQFSPVGSISEAVEPGSHENQTIIASPVTEVNWELIIISTYCLVSLFFIARIFLGMIQVFKLKRHAKISYNDNQKIFEIEDDAFKGASFFGWIFIGNRVGHNEMSILRHEQWHKQLYHSWDIILSHLYQAAFWLNPYAWILKKQIAINNELEVDQKMKEEEGVTNYASLLLNLSVSGTQGSIINHFSAQHLKIRIKALSNHTVHRKWIIPMSILVCITSFFIVSCSGIDETPKLPTLEQLKDIRTITTRFTSHQTDTQQKTGKVVAIATFLPDGTLDEFVEQTTYPYDHEFDKKKEFWDQPEKSMLPYIMDGLSLGSAEKSFLYGNDWPTSYAKYLQKLEKSEVKNGYPFDENIQIDDLSKPTEIKREKIYDETMIVSLGMPDITELYKYDGDKVIEKSHFNSYHEIDFTDERFQKTINFNGKEISLEEFTAMQRKSTGQVYIDETYDYEGDLLSQIVSGEYVYKFYYENEVLVKSEYFKQSRLLHTRFHYYKDGLKDRTEIFNSYNEPEYTISYHYEFWGDS